MKRLLLAAAVLTAGCAAPQQPVSIGFKDVPSDIILGAPATPSAVPGTSALPLGLGLFAVPPPASVVALPPPPFQIAVRPELPRPVVLPPLPSCPPNDPLAAPAREAPAQIAAPPVPASYTYTHDGSYAISGADPRSGRFPASSLRTVGRATVSATGFSFGVTDLLGDVSTTTSYQVVTATGTPNAPGLYLTQVSSQQGNGSATFAPAPALLLAAFPLVRGATVTSSGVDPLTATSMQFTSTVTGKTRVEACGVPLDSWLLDLSAGKILSPTQNLDFTASYALGTQFGGLLLRDRTVYRGTNGSEGVTRQDLATISVQPAAP